MLVLELHPDTAGKRDLASRAEDDFIVLIEAYRLLERKTDRQRLNDSIDSPQIHVSRGRYISDQMQSLPYLRQGLENAEWRVSSCGYDRSVLALARKYKWAAAALLCVVLIRIVQR